MPRQITANVTVYLTPEQITGLEQAARDQGISRAELVRRLVDEYLRKGAKKLGEGGQ